MCAGYSHQSFFTGHSLDSDRTAITSAGDSFVSSGYSVWMGLCICSVDAFIGRYCSLYGTSLAERCQACQNLYSECNRLSRLARAAQSSGTVSANSSTLSAVVRQTKEAAESKKRCQKPGKSNKQARDT